MTAPRVWPARLRALLFRNRLERELEAEIRFHLDMQADDNVRSGMGPVEAGYAASRSFGGVEPMKEQYRERRALPFVETTSQDVRYALRTMRNNPGFTITAVLSLAIGIGANCAVFTFADGFLLRPLPVPRPREVMTVGSIAAFDRAAVASYREYVDLRDRTRSFSGLVAFTSSAVAISLRPDSLPKAGIGMLVSGNFFQVMRLEPQLGRTFRAEEDEVPGRDAVVVLGNDFWVRQFAADPSILGRTIRLNEIDFMVIGVAPPEFTGLDQYTRFDFYAPLMMWPRVAGDSTSRPFEARDVRNLTIKGRLEAGVSRAEAQTELSIFSADLERAYPETNRNRRWSVQTELQSRIAQAPQLATLVTMLTVLAAAVLFVACANVAGLLTSRAPTRAREIALRLAIGAGRRRVIRQLITESLLIALVGGVIGLGVSYAGVTLFRQFRIPTDLPIAASFDLDRRALLVSLVVALVSAVLFGLAPAIRATRGGLTAVMKATDVAGFGRGRHGGRAMLVAGQVAVSFVLLVVATLVYRGFQQRLVNGPGFRTDHVLMMWFQPSLVKYNEAQSQRFFEQLAERVRSLPGVTSATLTSYVPMDGGVGRVAIVPEGFVFPVGIDKAAVPSAVVGEQYFETLKLPILEGRAFRATDDAGAPIVAVVNELFAEHYWPGEQHVGKRFRLARDRGVWVEVVGVAQSTKYTALTESPLEFVYFPFKQRPQPLMALLAGSIGEPADLVIPLREAVRSLDAKQPIFNVRTLEENYRLRAVVFANVVVRLIAAMGAMALALAIVGLYGLVAYAATRRTKEIGIRMAIGADRFDVVRMVLRQGLVLAVAGLAVGLVASLGVSRAMAAVFPGGPAGDGRTDVVAFVLVAAMVLVVAIVAAYIPARHASRVNPIEALRTD
jgi:putative ABC transport system permease protein